MSRSRTPLILGIAAAGGVGYYLYSAGGNPKVAEKKFESKFRRLPGAASAANAANAANDPSLSSY